MKRAVARLEFADKINELNKPELWEMGISRVSEVTGLDYIGCPTWVSCRPLSKTVSLNAGKSMDRMMARAGSIMESAEFCAAENPIGESILAPYSEVRDQAVDYSNLTLLNSSIMHEDFPIHWEWATEILSGRNKLIPSGVCWMHPRSKTFIGHFQNSSNGNASGYSIVDAIISGLYEVIERDAWTISEYLESHRVVENLPNPIKEMEDMAKKAGLKIEVFSCTQEDIGVPVFGAVVIGDDDGQYMGYGCNRCPVKAMERAVLEAFQSRCVYIAGARDDLFRRPFLLSKNTDLKEIHKALGNLGRDNSKYQELEDIEDHQEFNELSQGVKDAGFNEIYVKHLNTLQFKDFSIPAVKVIVPGLETCRMDGQWTPSPRCLKKKSSYTSAQA